MIVVLVVVLVGMSQYFTKSREEIVYKEVLSKPNPALIELRAKDHHILTTYAWVDSSKGIVRIPIQRAMDLMVNEAYAKQKGQPTGK